MEDRTSTTKGSGKIILIPCGEEEIPYLRRIIARGLAWLISFMAGVAFLQRLAEFLSDVVELVAHDSPVPGIGIRQIRLERAALQNRVRELEDKNRELAGGKQLVIEQRDVLDRQVRALRSQQKETRHDLRVTRKSLTFFTTTIEAISEAFILAEPYGKIVTFNGGAEELFELDSASASGLNLFQLLGDYVEPNGENPDTRSIPSILIQDGGIKNLRVCVKGASGRNSKALLTIDVVHDPRGPAHSYIIVTIKDNSEVEILTESDPLTGLFNRRHLDRELHKAYQLMLRRGNDCMSLLFADIDHFKKVNDTYGHQVGDRVLQSVAKVLQDTARDTDAAARYGGEEFVIALQSTDEEGARILAERVRENVSKLTFRVPEKGEFSVTVSLGCSTHRSGDESTMEFLTSEADKALYQAKNSGRNRVCGHVRTETKTA